MYYGLTVKPYTYYGFDVFSMRNRNMRACDIRSYRHERSDARQVGTC